MIRAVRYQDPDLQMPPDQPLSEQQIVDLEQWIDQGAPFPERTQDATEADQKPWWETTLKTTLPSLESDAAEVIDTFVLRQLQELSLSPPPWPANRYAFGESTWTLWDDLQHPVSCRPSFLTLDRTNGTTWWKIS